MTQTLTPTVTPFTPQAPPAPVTAADLDDDVDYLLNLGSDEFAAFVLANLDGGPKNLWLALTEPDVVARTGEVLIDRIHVLMRLFDARKAGLLGPDDETPTVAEYELVRRRQRQCKDAARQIQRDAEEDARAERERLQRAYPGYVVAEHRHTTGLAITLAVAINAHRRACISADLSPEPHDLTLWQLLDDLATYAPRGETASTLAELIVSGRWEQ